MQLSVCYCVSSAELTLATDSSGPPGGFGGDERREGRNAIVLGKYQDRDERDE